MHAPKRNINIGGPSKTTISFSPAILYSSDTTIHTMAMVKQVRTPQHNARGFRGELSAFSSLFSLCADTAPISRSGNPGMGASFTGLIAMCCLMQQDDARQEIQFYIREKKHFYIVNNNRTLAPTQSTLRLRQTPQSSWSCRSTSQSTRHHSRLRRCRVDLPNLCSI